MTSKYEIVIYQNMISGEHVNIGIFTYNVDENDSKVYSKFCLNWKRINSLLFGRISDDVDPILNGFVKSLSKVEDKIDLEAIRKMCRSPYASLRILEPRASLLSADKLLTDIENDFLI